MADAVQHFGANFTTQWIEEIRKENSDAFFVGEFWSSDLKSLEEWLTHMPEEFCLFDAPLVYNFSRISTTEGGDLRTILDGSLVQSKPVNAVV